MPRANSKRKTGSASGTKRKRTNFAEDSEPLAKKQATENPVDDSTPMLNLPKELFSKIWNLIPVGQWPSLEMVNRQFQSATHLEWRGLRQLRLDEFVYKKDLMNQDRAQFLINVWEKFCTRAPNIRSISGFSAIFPRAGDTEAQQEMREITVYMMAAFQFLESIDFSNSQISMTNLSDFLTTSNSRGSLKRIDITRMKGGHPFPMVQALSQGQPQLKLEILKMKSLPNYESQFLRNISLPWLTTFDGSNIDCTPAQLTIFIGQSPLIEHLEFRADIWNPGSPSPTHQILFNTVASLENLSALKITVSNPQKYCPLFEGAITNLIQSLGQRGKITEFGLLEWDYFDDEIIGAIGNRLVGLATLKLSTNLDGCSVESIKNLASNLIHLKRVYFMSPIIPRSIVSALGDFASLECLHLNSTSPSWGSVQFDGLARHGDLKELHIRDARMPVSALLALAKSIGPQLEILELTSCGKDICPCGLNLLIKKSPNFRRLVVRSAQLGNSVLEAISTNCPMLEYLELTEVKQVEAASIQAIIDHCPRLKYLKIVSTNLVNLEQVKVPRYGKIELELMQEEKMMI